jgi:membrane associated rhomboid family serine protease
MTNDMRIESRESADGRTLLDLVRKARNRAIILASFIAIIWLVELIDWIIFDHSLDAYGIIPRSVSGLKGIIFMPFLHANFGHVLANTVPFIILGALVILRRTRDFFIISAIIIIVSGLGVWFFGGPGTVHIGASALVFGYFGFLLLRAYFEWSLRSIIVALAVGLMYSGLIFGVLPINPGVSWQGHLFGFLGGVLAAYLLTSKPRGFIFKKPV